METTDIMEEKQNLKNCDKFPKLNKDMNPYVKDS